MEMAENKSEIQFGYVFQQKQIRWRDKRVKILHPVDVVLGCLYNSASGERFNLYRSFNQCEWDNQDFMTRSSCTPKDEYFVFPVPKIRFQTENAVLFNDICFELWEEVEGQNYYFSNDSKRTIQSIQDSSLALFAEQVFISDAEQKEKQKLSIDALYHQISSAVIAQDQAIRDILAAFFFNRQLFQLDLPLEVMAKKKQNILLYGPSGSGKTEIVQQLARALDIPVTIEDSTVFTAAGYVGGDVDDVIRHLYENADGNLEKAQHGIVVLDEIDKLAQVDSRESGVSTRDVQQSLLALLEGTKRYISKSRRGAEEFSFDTSQVTFIGMGAFEGIDDIAKQRKRANTSIGFVERKTAEKTILDQQGYVLDDFLSYGMERQLMARFRAMIELHPLEKEDYRQILLTSTLSPLQIQIQVLESMGVQVHYTEGFIEKTIELACSKGEGARGLEKIIQEALRRIQFELFSKGPKQITLTEDLYYPQKQYALRFVAK